MRIILISTDRKILEKGSAVQERMLEYSHLCNELHIIIFSLEAHLLVPYLQLTPNVFVYTTSSKNKWHYVKDAVWLAKNIIQVGDKKSVVVNTQDPFETGVVGWWLAKKLGVKWNVQIHTDVYSPYFANTFLNKVRVFISKILLPRATSIRVVSERIKQSIIKNKKIKITPVVLPIWTDIIKIENTCPLFYLHQKYPEYEYIILTVARLEKEKDIILSLKALQHVCRVYPKTGFIIVGHGSEKSALEHTIVELRLKKNVRFEGWQSDAIQYYKTADVYLCTSLYEGFGLSLFEAAASDCPIVTTDVGLVGSILSREKSVKVCDRNDTEIAQALIEVITDEEKRASMRKEAHKQVKAHSMTKAAYLKQYKKSLQ